MSDLIDRSDDPQLGRSLGLSRRQLLAATTGVAAAALGAAAFGGSPARALARRPAPPRRPRCQRHPHPARQAGHHPVHGARRDQPRPEHVDLASGFKKVFQELSRIGYKQIEFAGYNQHANAEGGNVNNVAGAQLLRKWLDDNGLEAEGNHGSIPGSITDAPRSPSSTPPARSRTSSDSATSARAATRPAAPTSPTGRRQPTAGTSSAHVRRRTG